MTSSIVNKYNMDKSFIDILREEETKKYPGRRKAARDTSAEERKNIQIEKEVTKNEL